MNEINVQFFDSTEVVICSVFSCPQDPSVYANPGIVDDSDQRYVTYYNDLPDIVRAGLEPPSP